MPFLTLLWANKGLVGVVLIGLLVLGLLGALKVQGARISSLKDEVATEERAKEAAIAAHDQLVRDWERQKAAMKQLEAVEAKREADYAALRKDLRAALAGNRLWADTRIPDSVRGSLQTMPAPASGPPGKPDQPAAHPPVRGPNQ